MNRSMSMTFRRTLPLLLFTAILMASCQKGDAGPQGPQGAQGPAGPQGPSGAANEKTYEFTAQQADWYPTGGSPGSWIYTAGLPALTQGIIDTGGVYVYWTQNDIQTLMPFTLNGVDFMYITGFPSGISQGTLQVAVTMAGAYTTANPSFGVPVTFKVIIDP